MDFSFSYKKNVSLSCTPEYLVTVAQMFKSSVIAFKKQTILKFSMGITCLKQCHWLLDV